MRLKGLAAAIVIALGSTFAGYALDSGDARRKAAEAGDVTAQRQLGIDLLYAAGAAPNASEGLEWLNKAAARGDIEALYQLGRYYETQAASAENRRLATERYLSAARLGHTTAQARLGQLFLARAVDPNLSSIDQQRAREQGLQLIEHSANAGNGYGALVLADMKFSGLGIPKDVSAAIALYQVATEHGQPTAAWMLYVYYGGSKAPQHDVGLALKYLQRAGEGNVPQATMELARRYLRGDGLPKDLELAEQWAARAAELSASDGHSLLTQIRAEQQAQQAAVSIVASTKDVHQPAPGAKRSLSAAPPDLTAVRWQPALASGTVGGTGPSTSPTASPTIDASAAPTISRATMAAKGARPTQAQPSTAVVAPRLGELNERVQSLETRTRTLEAERDRLTQSIAAKDARITELTRERDRAGGAPSAELAQAQTDIAHLVKERDALAAQKDQQIAQLTRELASESDARKRAEDVIATLEGSLSRFRLAKAATPPADGQDAAAGRGERASTVASSGEFRRATSDNQTQTRSPRATRVEGLAKLDLDTILSRGWAAMRAGKHPEAEVYFDEAARRGDARGMNNVGLMAWKGLGRSVDMPRAMDYFERAAAKGSAIAPHNIAMMYHRGIGVPVDLQAAAHWYRIAAERGNRDSQRELGALQAQPSMASAGDMPTGITAVNAR